MQVTNGELWSVTEEDVKLLNSLPDIFWQGVTKIGGRAFYWCNNLKSITIPSQIKEIGDFAFFECTSLKKVTFSEGLEKIGSAIFFSCYELESVTIPKSVKEINFKAFAGCSKLRKVKFKDISNMTSDLKTIMEGFSFDTLEQKGNEVVFIKNIEKDSEME